MSASVETRKYKKKIGHELETFECLEQFSSIFPTFDSFPEICWFLNHDECPLSRAQNEELPEFPHFLVLPEFPHFSVLPDRP